MVWRPDRFDGFFVVFSSAYDLLQRVGPKTAKHYVLRMWSSANRHGACVLFFIGRKMARRLRLTAMEALAALRQAILAKARKLGISHSRQDYTILSNSAVSISRESRINR